MKLKLKRFSDHENSKIIVCLPNPTNNQSMSGKEEKIKRRSYRGRKYKKLEKKEEVDQSRCQNPITKYFRKEVPSIHKFGKRKIED